MNSPETDPEKNAESGGSQEDVPNEAEAFLAKSANAVPKSQIPYGLTPKACLSVGVNIVAAVGLVCYSKVATITA
jgi:hypothetical protein